jgi:hypothetical protein
VAAIPEICYGNLKAMPMKSVLEVARELAEAHRVEDPATDEIFLAQAENEVRLVEVSRSVSPTEGGKVLPFRFAPRPDLGVPYDSVVVLLSPGEWEEVRAGRLSLPSGWGSAAELHKIA